jgi:uncharacterized protein
MGRASPVERFLGLPPATRRRVRVEADLAVPMRDGVVLRADRYVPDGEDRAPLVLLRTPYGRKHLWKRLYCRPLARRGYQVVIQSCRGTEDSGGTLTPFDERDDGVDTVAWLREQPWYPGRFATAGPSYWGVTQWALAAGAPGDLAAMVPVLTSARLVRSLFPGGAFSLETWLGWSALIAAQQDHGPGLATLLRARARRLSPALRHLPLAEADRQATGRTLPWWRDWLDAAGSGGDGLEHLDWSSAVRSVAAPVAMVTSWYDHFAPWQLQDWAELSEAAEPRRLVIAPWVHEDPKLLRLYMRETIAWLDAHLRDDASGLHGGPVRYFVTGAEQWRDAPAWPPPGGRTLRLHLHAGGRLAHESPEADAPETTFRYDPADPTPSAGGPTARSGARVLQHAVESRDDVVTFTTDALIEPVETVGTGRARIHVGTNAGHADLVVRVCDVDPDGSSRNVTDGIRRFRAEDHAADATGARVVDVDLWPAGHRFAQGHRIRVQVAGAAFPRFDRNPGSEDAATATRHVAMDLRIHHDAAHPSHLLLPSMPVG